MDIRQAPQTHMRITHGKLPASLHRVMHQFRGRFRGLRWRERHLHSSLFTPGSSLLSNPAVLFFFFQAEDGIRDWSVTGVQTCALPSTLQPGLLEPASAAQLLARNG